MRLEGERVLLRIHLNEQDEIRGETVYSKLVDICREAGLAGVTIMRAAMGFGQSGQLHSDRIEVLSLNLPMVIECVDTEENIRGILPALDSIIGGGLITLERADVIIYRPHTEPPA